MYSSLPYTFAPLRVPGCKRQLREGDNEEANLDVGVRLCDGNGNVFIGFDASGSDRTELNKCWGTITTLRLGPGLRPKVAEARSPRRFI